MLKSLLEKILDFYIINYHNKKLLKYIQIEEFNTIIDVGSHRGELLKSLTNFNYKYENYIAFEPVSSLYSYLEREFSKEENLTLYNLALGNRVSKDKIYMNAFSSTNTFKQTNNNLFKYKIKNALSYFMATTSENIYEEVQIEKLDNFIDKIPEPLSLLKVDTEGYELEVLQGSKNFLTEHNPKFLIIEIQKQENYLNYNPDRIEKLILDLGYKKIFEINGPFSLFKDYIYKSVTL